MKNLVIIFLFLSGSIHLFAQPRKKEPLDGKTFIVEMYKDGKKKPMDPDEFRFASAKFKSKFFSQSWGFKQAPYKITAIDSSDTEAKIYSWTAITKSDIDEITTWTGTVDGEDLKGTAELVNKKGKTEFTFTFTGKLKGKPGKKKK